LYLGDNLIDMDTSAWINLGILLVTAIGAAAAWRAAGTARKERLASEAAKEKSEAARDEATRLAREANEIRKRQAAAQEKLAAAAAPEPWTRIDEDFGNSTTIELRHNGETTFEDVSIGILPSDGELEVETVPDGQLADGPGLRIHPGQSIILRYAPSYDGANRHDVQLRWKVAGSEERGRRDYTVS